MPMSTLILPGPAKLTVQHEVLGADTVSSSSDNAFDPETVRVLTAAFDDAWRELGGRSGIGPDKHARRD
jgi:hypothetical protein